MPVYNSAGVRLKIVSLKDLRERGIRYSRVHIDRLVKSKKFPPKIKLGENRVGWLESDIDDWIQAKVDERDAA